MTQRQQWQDKLCPQLTQAALIGFEIGKALKGENKIALVGGNEPEKRDAPAQRCQGQLCMWFTPEANEKGQVIGGKCAVEVAALSNHTQTILMNHALELVAKKLGQ